MSRRSGHDTQAVIRRLVTDAVSAGVGREHIIPREISPRWPFGMSRAVAAEYTGFSLSHFDKMVEDGRMPAPRREGSRLVWLQDELQASLRALPREGDAAETTVVQWKA